MQAAYWTSPHRFNVVSSGRRSGKTEIAKRRLVRAAIRGTQFDNARFFAGAPTRDQAKKIFWKDLKALSPPWLLDGNPAEGDLIIRYLNGSEICVLGMDVPQRIEGQPWDGGILDEYANMKAGAWGANVRPALSDRLGWCDLIGVPEGKNHYYDLNESAKVELALKGPASEWGSFAWVSGDVLPPEEIAAAQRDLPPMVFRQEYMGEFVDWSGVAFFERDKLLVDKGKRNPRGDAVYEPLDAPERLDAIFAIIDTALKTGKENDGTAVVYYGVSKTGAYPLAILDWDTVQIEGALLDTWLTGVFQTLEGLAKTYRPRMGSLGAFIEDKVSGTILLQQARRRNLPVRAIDSQLTAMGKDERALSVSGYVHRGLVKFVRHAYDKTTVYKTKTRNHLLGQIVDFRVGDKAAAKRADDLLDCFTYGISIALGDNKGY